MLEKWLSLEGYDIYKVSNLGRIMMLEHVKESRNQHKSFLKNYPEKILSLSNDKDGYKLITLRGKVTKRVHRIVASLFIPNPENKSQVNHINGIKDDNRVCNLEWVTPAENYQHAYDTELNKGPLGSKNNQTKLSEEQVLLIKEKLEEGSLNQLAISKLFKISPSTISNIKLGITWSHVTKYPYKGRIIKHQGDIK